MIALMTLALALAGTPAEASSSPVVDLLLLAPEASWQDGSGKAVTFGGRTSAEHDVRARLERHLRLEDGTVQENCLATWPGGFSETGELIALFSLAVPRGAARLEVNVGFPPDAPATAKAAFEVGIVRGGERVPRGRVLARADHRIDGLRAAIGELAASDQTFYLRVRATGLPNDVPAVWTRAWLTRGTPALEDLLAKAPASRFEAAGRKLSFGNSEGPAWVGWQSDVPMADGTVYDRVLATYPPATEEGAISAAFLVAVPRSGARVAGAVGLPMACRGGSSVRLELSFETSSGAQVIPLGDPIVLLPERPPQRIDSRLTSLAGRTGFIVARLTVIGRPDRAWPTWTELALVEDEGR
ncbi:MAG: hypothetical protein AB1486_26880 [Planctomycetota bacterium]